MDRIKEKLGYYKILVPLVWTGIFLASSGTSWIIVSKFPFKEFLIPLMVIFITILVNYYQ